MTSRPSPTRPAVLAGLTVVLGALAAAGCGDAPADADDGADVGAAPPTDTAPEVPRLVSYTMVRGDDTLAVERVLRSPGRLASEAQGDTASGPVILFEATTRANGLIRSITLEPRAAGEGSRPTRRTTVHFEGGMAVIGVPEGDSIVTDSLTVPDGTLPWIDTSVALVEQLALRARELATDTDGADTLPADTVPADTLLVAVLDLEDGGREVREATVRFDTPTSITVRIEPDDEVRVTLDEDGRVARMETVRRGVTGTRMR